MNREEALAIAERVLMRVGEVRSYAGSSSGIAEIASLNQTAVSWMLLADRLAPVVVEKTCACSPTEITDSSAVVIGLWHGRECPLYDPATQGYASIPIQTNRRLPYAADARLRRSDSDAT